MPTNKCIVCQFERETLDPSGVCFVCTERTEATRLIDAEAPTRTREQPGTITQGGAANEWVGALPPGGYRYDDTPLGEGGMGVVWRVVRESTGETFAIKKLKARSFTPTGIRRFVAEAHSLAAVQHDHVVRLYDFVPDPTDPFLVLEFVPGESLGAHIKSVGPLHPDRAARMMAEAARGVGAAHAAGVVHRDLKPGNLLLTLNGKVKVADFGLCKTLGDADAPGRVGVADGDDANTPVASNTLTGTGRLAGGTPGFMAPEQVSEDYGEVTPATDVWGLGACLHAALTAQAPFPVGEQNLGRVLTDPLVPPHAVDPRVPEALSEIVTKCLTKDPKGRYATAAAVAADLESYLAGEGTSVRPHSWARRQWGKVRKAPLGLKVATAVAVLAVAAGIGLAMVPKQKNDPLTVAQKKLAAGDEVVLVDDGKFLLPHNWQIGDAVLTEPTESEPFATFACRDLAMLTVLPDPGTDRYRISARLRQLPVTPAVAAVVNSGEPSVGIAWGYRESAFPDGTKARAYMALQFGERAPNPKFPSRLGLWDHGQVETPLALPTPVRQMSSAHCPIEFVPQLPGPWRELTVDVAADELVLHLPGGPQRLNAEKVAENCHRLEASLSSLANGRPLGTPHWSPRSPVGVYVNKSRVAVERFVITTLPPK